MLARRSLIKMSPVSISLLTDAGVKPPIPGLNLLFDKFVAVCRCSGQCELSWFLLLRIENKFLLRDLMAPST